LVASYPCVLAPRHASHTNKSCLSLSHTHTSLGAPCLLALYPVRHATRHATHIPIHRVTLSPTHTHSAENTGFASGVTCESCESCESHVMRHVMPRIPISLLSLTHTHKWLGAMGLLVSYEFAGAVWFCWCRLLVWYPVSHVPRYAAHTNTSCHSLSHTHAQRWRH